MSEAVHIVELHLMTGVVFLLRHQPHKHQGHQVE